MKKYIIAAIGFLIMIAACKKDHPAHTSVNGPAQVLAGDTAKYWVDFLRQYTKNGDNTIYSVNTPCYDDDNWIFRKNGSFEFNEGGSKCNPGDPYVEATGNWKLSSDNKSIIFSNVVGPGLNSSFSFQITELTDNKLSVSLNASDIYSGSTTENQEFSTLVPK